MFDLTIMVLGDSMAFLCISLNNSSVDNIHLIDGELIDIDKYTIKFDTSKALLKEYPDKIEEFKHIYNLDNETYDIKVRIFLANDKEQFVMYRKHLVAFKALIKNRSFLRYAIMYENTLFSKWEREFINDENVSDIECYNALKKFIINMDEDSYYALIRRLCDQYNNFIEDYSKQDYPTIDMLFKDYIIRLKQNKLSQTGPITPIKSSSPKSPFAVFKHPNFFKTYGRGIDKDKPIFILGGKITGFSRDEYKELNDNCVNCFSNPIYYPLNADVNKPIDNEYASIFDNALLIVVNGDGYTQDLGFKIKRASSKGITVLILVNDERLLPLFQEQFINNDAVIIKKYQYQDYASQKEFADLAVGLYINACKKQQVTQ